MKKVVCILLALMMLLAAVPTLAEDVDLSQYTDAQLQQGLDKAEEALEQVKDLIEKIKEEQARRSGDTAASSKNGVFQHTPVTVKRSPDKYTWYIQDYVGRNAASIGYASLGGDRLERSLKRERKQEHPRYAEVCRRFLADEEDFSEENLAEAGIARRYRNENLEDCLAALENTVRYGII